MKEYFKTLMRYNAWANDRLYASCQLLSSEAYFLDRHAFFTSIHGTLNHLLVGDKLWLARWRGVDSGVTALNQILYPDLDSLSHARKAEDQSLISFIDAFDAAQLDGSLTFYTLAGQAKTVPWKYLMAHLCNHQTHHRGQVHNMLSQAGQEPPVLDLYYYLST